MDGKAAKVGSPRGATMWIDSMQDDNQPDKPDGSGRQGFFTTLLQGLIRDTAMLWIAVLIGTGLGAIICLYFGAPLIFSLLGGVLVLAVYVAWSNL